MGRGMDSDISLSEYLDIAEDLPDLEPTDQCCEASWFVPILIEPYGGRRSSEVERTCIVQCENCGAKFVSWWD